MTIRFLLLAVAVALAGCQSVSSPDISRDSSPVLRVGMTPNSPPLVFRRNGELAGLETDFARALGEALRRPVRVASLKWEELIPSLERGDVDVIMAGMTITSERAVRVRFTEPYMEVGQLALFRAKDARKFPNRVVVQTTAERVGVEQGTTSDIYAQRMMMNATRVAFASSKVAVDALVAGEVGVVLCDAPMALWLASENESRGVVAMTQLMTREQLAWAVRRDDAALAESVNAALRGWKQEGKLRAMIHRWVPYYENLQQALME
jgi:polar amino acid transport system substrate-binding protein